jgi:zinc transport system ATP-binding protein
MEQVVDFKNVCFSYNGHEVLHNVSFTAGANSFTGIVGPNGGGKTTLLRLMLGLIKPQRGSVSIFGASAEKARGRVGYVMQHMDYDSSFPATALDVALMGRAGKRSWGFYGASDKKAALDALDMVGLSGAAGRSFATLSGGQQQRSLIAQALAGSPRLLLLDEPTANIDAEGDEAIHRLLNTLASQLTVITVSHNINTVLKCVSHVLCVNKTAAISPLEQLSPETISCACGSDMAVLHHARSCQVFARERGGSCEHHAGAITGDDSAGD